MPPPLRDILDMNRVEIDRIVHLNHIIILIPKKLHQHQIHRITNGKIIQMIIIIIQRRNIDDPVHRPVIHRHRVDMEDHRDIDDVLHLHLDPHVQVKIIPIHLPMIEKKIRAQNYPKELWDPNWIN